MIESLTHHAYGIAGSADAIVPKVLLLLEKKLGYKTRDNPDFRLESFEVFGIGEARALKESAERKAVTGGKKVFVISARGVTSEAQNALLKMCEEAPEDTHFFLIVPVFESLLPTLRSRLFLIRDDGTNNGEDTLEAKHFLAKSISERLGLIQKMLKALEGEKKEKEDSTEVLLEKGRILGFLDALERKLGEDTATNANALTEVLEVKKYSRDRAPSLKLLLEHLALILPRVE
ncbi:MAG: hypothetical protein EXS51_04275 [Candidatus Taylorbacteria bacterium]|nr:hypothetical protein [Candidatus Taylorbacteria bacterium]